MTKTRTDATPGRAESGLSGPRADRPVHPRRPRLPARRCAGPRRRADGPPRVAPRAIRAAFACAAFLALAWDTAAAQDATLVTDVAVVDVAAGTVTESLSILVEDGRVVAVGPRIAAPTGGAERFDAGGAYAIPGLWDSHVHIFSTPTEPETALPLYLIHGVTGIRDMGALWPVGDQKALQRRVETGEVRGPRIVLSGAWVDAAPGSWPGMFLADTPGEARAAVARIAAEGWAAVKAYAMLDPPTYLALAEAAARHGLPLVGHVPEQVTLGTAIAAGQDGVEHFGRVTMACATAEGRMVADLRDAVAAGAGRERIFELMAARNRIVLETWDRALCADVLARMAEAELHVSPTLVVADFYTGARPEPDAPRMRTVPAEVRAAWRGPDFRLEAMTDEVRALAEASIELDLRTFLMAHDAGVPVLAATDASFANPFIFHGASLLDELDRYVAAGLAPGEALYTATVAPPRFFGLADQDGTIAPGRRADLVLLDSNPLDDLATLRRPVAVMAGGALLDRAALDAIEARLRETAAPE